MFLTSDRPQHIGGYHISVGGKNEKFGQKQWETRAKAIGNLGKSNGKYGEKQ